MDLSNIKSGHQLIQDDKNGMEIKFKEDTVSQILAKSAILFKSQLQKAQVFDRGSFYLFLKKLKIFLIIYIFGNIFFRSWNQNDRVSD